MFSFFRCNRWEGETDHDYYAEPPPENEIKSRRAESTTDPSRMEITYGTAMHETRASREKKFAMTFFLHHYQRWDAHLASATLERSMRDAVVERLGPVVEEAKLFIGDDSFNFEGKGLSFVHSAFTELLECRSMLQHSYAFAFFRYKSLHPLRYRLVRRVNDEKKVFETVQSELEMLTEQMSNIVARSHLRATQTQIVFLTATTR
jgi:Ariadne domain